MKQFLMGAVVATVVLGAAGFAVMKEPAAAPIRRTVPLKLSDLTLDRAFRYAIPTGAIIAAPSDLGFVLTSLFWNTTSGFIQISLNGASPVFVPVGNAVNAVGADGLSSPLVVRPGETMTFGQFQQGQDVTVSGYFVYPGEV